jgi:hypothetical protein
MKKGTSGKESARTTSARSSAAGQNHCGRKKDTHRHSKGLLQELAARQEQWTRRPNGGQATGHTRFLSDANKKELTPEGTTLDAIVAGLICF